MTKNTKQDTKVIQIVLVLAIGLGYFKVEDWTIYQLPFILIALNTGELK